jgi:hypothetical protein
LSVHLTTSLKVAAVTVKDLTMRIQLSDEIAITEIHAT